MDKFDDIPNISYGSPLLDKIGIDILDLTQFLNNLSQQGVHPYEPHRVSYFCFIFLEQGKGQHSIDCHSYPYQSNSIIFVNKGQIHAFDQQDRPKGKLLILTPEFFSAASANIRTSYFVPVHQSLSAFPILHLCPGLKETSRALLNEMKTALTEGADSSVIVQLLFSALLIKLAKQRDRHLAHLSEQQKNRFGEFLRLVDNHFTESREASQYAQLLHTSYKSLNQLCKVCCGHTAKQLIDFRIILEIKRKLTLGGCSVQQAAFELGFEDTTHFIKYFKRHTGKTPAAFKRAYEG
ncbi:AraC family transcriptional regulator [Ferrimonas sp. SCSIO 43195]|uniref:helix-turn-helix domain-containing protein n=1 Tax=Ferrimonas sp. SCSIO 43195 TaxID=2822844 RepID=UPI002076500D|nr:helix-turn-helix domain-containing protein [Ferrimonas sp. SCSIO 43195]USD38129.1 helix-turn-helix domain-containing protein [Ferrimonas sp. SCSIO 43195]